MAVMDGVTEDVRISSQCLCIHITINKMLLCSLLLDYECHIHTVCQCACTVRSGSRRWEETTDCLWWFVLKFLLYQVSTLLVSGSSRSRRNWVWSSWAGVVSCGLRLHLLPNSQERHCTTFSSRETTSTEIDISTVSMHEWKAVHLHTSEQRRRCLQRKLRSVAQSVWLLHTTAARPTGTSTASYHRSLSERVGSGVDLHKEEGGERGQHLSENTTQKHNTNTPTTLRL